MSYKKIQFACSSADMAIQAYSQKNRKHLFLQEIDSTIDWEPMQTLLLKYYEPGKSKLGEVAYPPLFYSNAFCVRNGFGSNPIRNWKARSMIESLSDLSWSCRWSRPVLIIRLFPGSVNV